MRTLDDGIFQARNGEEISLDISSTGAETLFGVNFSMSQGTGLIPEGQPFKIKLDKSKAEGDSDIPNAKSTVLLLTFNFTSERGGNYDLTVTGAPGGDSHSDSAPQAGRGPTFIPYTFHIV